MIIRLNKIQQTQARRQILSDVVWAVCNEPLKKLQSDNSTQLSPVEAFMSARAFNNVLLSLPDVDEGITYEMDDLEAEAEGGNDAMIIMMVAAVQMQALSKRHVGADIKNLVYRIFCRWESHKLFLPLLEQFAIKEEARFLEGKRNNLLDYEIREIELEGGGSEEIREFFEYFVSFADKADPEAIKNHLLILNSYNNEHNHAYDKEIGELYEKLGIRSTMVKTDEYVALKHVENEIKNIEPGGIGVNKEYKKD